jgi:hypothetical protein
MRKLLFGIALSGVLALAGAGAPAAAATGQDTAGTLEQPRPAWLTPDLEARIVAAGPKGVEVTFERPPDGPSIEPNCLGTAPPYAWTDGAAVAAVTAGTCMVAPHGCTMNFVFTDGAANYIGTAGHCVSGGSTVIAQIATRVDPTDSLVVTLAAIGKVAKRWNQGIGKDFALVRIAPGFKVNPAVAGALGPTGALCVDPVGQPIMHYGHGYVFFVEQGHPKFGEVIPDLDAIFRFASPHGFNWVGYGLPGDSGSAVMNDAGLAAGDLTHGIGVLGVPVPGLNFGTDMVGIFQLLGRGYDLVTADRRRVSCRSGPIGV